MRILAISDIHIGLDFNLQMLIKFRQIVERERPDAVVLVGDIFELILSNWDLILKEELSKNGFAEIYRIGKLVPTYYINGNHDIWGSVISQYDNLVPIALSGEKLELDGITFIHGHQDQFDPTTKFWRFVTAPIRKWLPLLWRKLKHTPRELLENEKYRAKWDISAGTITMRVFNWMRNEYLSPSKLVFGHLHKDFILQAADKDMVLANCGDMMGVCSYIDIRDGEIEAIYL